MRARLRFASQLRRHACVAAACCAIALHLWQRDEIRNHPPAPGFPFTGGAYPSMYRGESADHYLFRHGMLGMGRRLQESDLLVLGSSHALMGISAAQLSKELTQRTGRPVRAYNAALGHAEGISYFRDIVERNALSGKQLIVDVHNWRGSGISDVGEKARKAGLLDAYVRVGNLWSRNLADWLLDGVLPRAAMQEGRFTFARPLDWVVLRDWKTGDVVEWWSPMLGPVYRDAAPGSALRLDSRKLDAKPGEFAAPFASAFPQPLLAARRLSPLLTLVPFPGANEAWARAEAAKLALPFAAIAPAGLEFAGDGVHLTAAGRAKATALLAKEIR